jgi:hypothetical protein
MNSLLQSHLAHAGPHDLSNGDGVLHALTAPDHLLAAAACVAGAYVAFFVYRRLAWRKPQAVRESTPSPSGRGRG